MNSITYRLKHSRIAVIPDLVCGVVVLVLIYFTVTSFLSDQTDTASRIIWSVITIAWLSLWWKERKNSIEVLRIDESGLYLNRYRQGNSVELRWSNVEKIDNDAASIDFFCRKGNSPRYYRLPLSWFEFKDWEGIIDAVKKYSEE